MVILLKSLELENWRGILARELADNLIIESFNERSVVYVRSVGNLAHKRFPMALKRVLKWIHRDVTIFC